MLEVKLIESKSCDSIDLGKAGLLYMVQVGHYKEVASASSSLGISKTIGRFVETVGFRRKVRFILNTPPCTKLVLAGLVSLVYNFENLCLDHKCILF